MQRTAPYGKASRAAGPDPLGGAFRATAPALAATFLLSLFINAALLASPIYSMQVFNRVLQSRNLTTLLMLSAMLLACLIVYGVLEYARSGVLVRAGVSFERRLRRPLFDAMMWAELDPERRTGQRVIRDAELLRESLANGTASVLCDLPWAPLYVALCWVLHPALGCVACAGAVLLFALAMVTEFTSRARVEATTRLSNEAAGFAASALRNGEAVRGLGMGDIVLERWCGHQAAAVAAQAASHEASALLVAASRFARVGVQSAMLGVGAWLVVNGEISAGVMSASTIIMGRALSPVEQIVGQWKRIIACRGAHGRLARLFSGAPVAAAPVQLPTPVGHIQVEGAVVVPIGSNRPSVRGVSFDLAAGQSLAIIGSSGSGKSSLSWALTGVWPLAAGAIRVDGAALTQWDPNRLGKHVGYLPQDVELFAGTVAENIARLGTVSHAAVVEAAKMSGAHDVILRLPQGYDTPIGEGPFAIGRFELTLGEFRAFALETGFKPEPGCYSRNPEWRLNSALSWAEPGFPQDDRHPAACLSLDDAKAYAAWLSQRTGKAYRLPTDPEWHAAAAAGAPEAATPQCAYANGADETVLAAEPTWVTAACRDGYRHTAPVGSLAPTGPGLADLFGNLWEWVDSCVPDFSAPTLAFGSCPADAPRILRGGSWSDPPARIGLDPRSVSPPAVRDQIVGARLLRELTPCEAGDPASGCQ